MANIEANIESTDGEEIIKNETCDIVLDENDEGEEAPKNGDIVVETGDGMSKRAKKKLAKRQQWLDTKHERRAKEKEKRKLKLAALKLMNDYDETRASSRKSLKHNKMSDSACKVGVVFDMQFGDLMTQRDLGKCLKQIMKCYSFNRRLSNQLQLHMTSLGGNVEAELSKNDGWKNWDFNFDSRRYDEVFAKERIVYLSSESETAVTELEDDKVYVIGGLVDHNHHKGLSHSKATELGIATARLPIDEFLSMKSRKVLTVNHVYEILAAVSEGTEWKEAFLGVIPERKLAEGAGGEEVIKAKCESSEEQAESDVAA